MADPLQHWPLWLLGAVFLAALSLAREAGIVLQRRMGRRERGGQASEEASFIVSASLGLLALLLGFTFSMALNRYDDRRTLVYQEAEAIGTAWLRAGLLETPDGTALQAQLRRYARSRLGLAAAGEDSRAIARAMDRGAALRAEIWRLTAAGVAPIRTTAQAAALVDSVNQVIDLATTREQTLRARVPDAVMTMLFAYAAVTALLIGYLLGAGGQPHRALTTLLFILLATAMMLILDLDRPRAGLILIDQQAMVDAIADMDRLALRPPA